MCYLRDNDELEGGGGRWIPALHWPATLALLVKFQAKQKVKGIWEMTANVVL